MDPLTGIVVFLLVLVALVSLVRIASRLLVIKETLQKFYELVSNHLKKE